MNVQWGIDQVYKVGGKMFAVTAPGHGCSLKVSDIAFEALIDTGQARPAPYMARAKWVRFDELAQQNDAEMADWLKTAHELVAARLTRKVRAQLGLA